MFRLGQSIAPLLFGLCYQAGSFTGLFGSGLALALVLTLSAVLSFAYADKMEHVHHELNL